MGFVLESFKMSSIIFRRFKSKGPEFKEQKLDPEKSRGTDKTLKRHITVINVILAGVTMTLCLHARSRFRSK